MSTSESAPADRSRRAWIAAAAVAVFAAVVFVPLLIHLGGQDHGPEKACEAYVAGQLTSPATARFSGEQFFDTDSPEVSGSVDSQNGYGAVARSQFSCTMSRTGGGWQVLTGFVA